MIESTPTLRAALALALLGLALPAGAQNLLSSDVDQQRQLRTVWSERAESLQAEWQAASEDVRARGIEALSGLRHSGAPRGVWPALAELSGAQRVMRGENLEELRADPFARQVDGLDLEVAPGAFPAGARDTASPSLGVRVYSTGGPRPTLPVELRLTWIASDGTRISARRTEIEPEAWIAPGFEVFVTPPSRAAGTWRLEPSLLLEGRTLRGHAVEVECVERLDERLAALRSVEAARLGPGPTLLRYQFELLLSHGIRLPGGLAPSRALALLEASAAGGAATAGLPRPAPDGSWSWEPPAASGEEPRRVLLVPAGSQEDPARIVVGAASASWLAMARALEAVIVSVPMTRQPAQWNELLAATRAAYPGCDLFVIARGEVAVRLRLQRMVRPEDDWGLAGLVLSGVSLAPIGGEGTGPILQLAPGMESRPGTYPEDASADLGLPTFLAEPFLPERILAWLRP